MGQSNQTSRAHQAFTTAFIEQPAQSPRTIYKAYSPKRKYERSCSQTKLELPVPSKIRVVLSQNNLTRLDTEPKTQTSTVSSQKSTRTNSGQNDFIDDMFQSELS
jgi:hypothetical protein